MSNFQTDILRSKRKKRSNTFYFMGLDCGFWEKDSRVELGCSLGLAENSLRKFASVWNDTKNRGNDPSLCAVWKNVVILKKKEKKIYLSELMPSNSTQYSFATYSLFVAWTRPRTTNQSSIPLLHQLHKPNHMKHLQCSEQQQERKSFWSTLPRTRPRFTRGRRRSRPQETLGIESNREQHLCWEIPQSPIYPCHKSEQEHHCLREFPLHAGTQPQEVQGKIADIVKKHDDGANLRVPKEVRRDTQQGCGNVVDIHLYVVTIVVSCRWAMHT